jgi:hypothetical protein
MNELTIDQFVSALNKEDDLGMVIRTHIHIEHWLERYLCLCVPLYEEYKTRITPEYESKINLALAMGLEPELKPILKALGTLRNRFAHQPDQTLKANDVDNLYKTLSPSQKQLLQKTYRYIVDGSEESERLEKDYTKLSVERRLGIIFLFAWSSIRLACEERRARA